MAEKLNVHLPPNIILPPGSDEWVERSKWQRHFGLDGTRPIPVSEGGRGEFVYEEFPKMIYKGGRIGGRPAIVETRTVHDRDDEQRALDEGFRVSQVEALAYLDAQELEFAKLSANQNYHAQRMSEKAQAELETFNQGRALHQPVMPEQPIKRRPGRPKKAATPETGV